MSTFRLVFNMKPNCLAVIFATSILVLALFLRPAQSQSNDDGSLPTSVAGMMDLMQTEKTLIDALEEYGKELQKRADVVGRSIKAMREQNNKGIEDPEGYLANPLNAFSLVRRMQADWLQWELFVTDHIAKEQVATIRKLKSDLPSREDMIESVDAINRIQYTYDLKADDMAKGILNGRQYNASLSSIDCFTIGKELYYQMKYYESAHWFYAANQMHKDSDMAKMMDIDTEKILLNYAQVLFLQNRGEDAVRVMDSLIKIYPENKQLVQKRSTLEMMVKTQTEPPTPPPPVGRYELGCRGVFSKKLSNLHCRYNTTTSDFLKLAPLKMEEISSHPYIVLYHDVISDNEIEELKNLALPKLKRATVFSAAEKKSQVDKKRTSKFAWLKDDTSETTERLNRRIEDMTGFDMHEAENLQVMNYGLGGHYDTHYDFFNTSDTADIVRMRGDRISTVLFYISDVEQGGATVFPNIKQAIFPRKGSAVVWHNLNDRLVADRLTMHAACPVVAGSKWVVNKWIRSKAQMFRKPCYK